MLSSSSKVHKQLAHRPLVGKSSTGLTRSPGGVPIKAGPGSLAGKGRKKRKYYPLEWGSPVDQMTMRRRVLCCFNGPQRLSKDEMMMNNEYEVRMKLCTPAAPINLDSPEVIASLSPPNLGDAVRMRRLERPALGPGENPNYYVTDLDVATIARANGFHGAPDDEKTVSTSLSGEDVEHLMM